MLDCDRGEVRGRGLGLQPLPNAVQSAVGDRADGHICGTRNRDLFLARLTKGFFVEPGVP